MTKKRKDAKYLRAKRGKIRRYETAVFDLETKDGDSQQAGFTRPFLACFYDGQEHRLFRNAPQLRSWAIDRVPHLEEGGLIDALMRHVLGMNLCGTCEVSNEEALSTGAAGLQLCPECRKLRRRYSAARCRIFAHNGGRFDALFILPWLLRHKDRFKWEISGPESKILRLEIWPRRSNKKRLSWVIQDSVAILPMSLDQVGKVFLGDDLKGQKKQVDLHMHEDDPEWDVYVKQDCTVLYKGVEKLTTLVTSLGGEVGMTAPATAMSIFRRAFLDKPIVRNAHFDTCQGTVWDDVEEEDRPCYGCLHDFIRQGYYGGRTELFETSGHDVSDFDVNSSYPFSMTHRMPAGRAKIFGPVDDLEVFRKLHKTHVGFVEADVWIPPFNPQAYAGQQRIPPLPVRFEGKLIFPTGSLRGVWSWDELELLYHPRIAGSVVKVYRSVWFEARPVFDGFVASMYAYRQAYKSGTGNAAMDALAKLMMNSLYGKFGMRIERGKLVFVPVDEPDRLKLVEKCRPVDNEPDEAVVWEEPVLVNAPYVVPQLAAQVTTLSRILLWKGMISVLDQGGRVKYSDSISEGRCVVVQNPRGRELVLPVGRLFDLLADGRLREDGKEYVEAPEGWRALAIDSTGQTGFFPLERVIRHRAGKPLHLISTKEGQTEVTSDHGIMVEGAAVTPEAFLEKSLRFTRVIPPADGVVFDLIDLLRQELEDVRYAVPRGAKYKGIDAVYRFIPWHAEMRNQDGIRALTKTIKLDGPHGRDESMIKCLYTGDDLRDLLTVIGAFVSEGASSLTGHIEPKTARFDMKTAVRNCWSVSQNDPHWLLDVKRALERITVNVHTEIYPSRGASILRSGAKFLSVLFAALCGEGGSKNRRLPGFCMNLSREMFLHLWQKLVEGDGSVDKRQGTVSYCTQSLELASQLSYLLRKHGFDHSTQYRHEKKAWTLVLREGKPRKARVIKHEVREPSADEYVYDLTVSGAHTFVDALGCVLLHNTDSIMCTGARVQPEGKALGQWKNEYPDVLLDGTWVLPKLYQLRKHAPDCEDPGCPGCRGTLQRMKGVPGRMQTAENFNAIIPRSFGGLGQPVTFERLTQHRTMIAKHLESPVMEKTFKTIRTEYDKRALDRQSGQTEPLHLRFIDGQYRQFSP